MSNNLFSDPIIHAVIDYLTQGNVTYTMNNNQWIITTNYSFKGKDIPMQIIYDPATMVLTFQVEAERPIPKEITGEILDYLNECNARVILGRSYLCPCCNTMNYRFDVLLLTQSVNNAEISLYMEKIAEAFVLVEEGLDYFIVDDGLEQDMKSTDDDAK